MLNKLQARFSVLSQREQLVVSAAILIIIWVSWDSFFFQPTQKKLLALQVELGNLKTQIANEQLAAIKLENNIHSDPNLINQNKLAQLKSEYQRLQNLMMADEKSFAPPHLVVVALNDILNPNNPLTLIKLDTLPVSTLLQAKQQAPANPVYKHGIIITLSGNYLDTLNYLKALEALPWHFLWDSIDYQVKDYPNAETTIKLYTLSFKESWLGV